MVCKFEMLCLNRKLLTGAGVSICVECVSRFTVTAIATVCIHAALGTRPLQETALVHIWSQYETLFRQQIEILVVNEENTGNGQEIRNIRLTMILCIILHLHHTAVLYTPWSMNTRLVVRTFHSHMTSRTPLWRMIDTLKTKSSQLLHTGIWGPSL